MFNTDTFTTFLPIFPFQILFKVREKNSGVARVIVFGGQVASGEGILGGPPPNFLTDLDFWNGLEHNWGGAVAPSRHPLNYVTGKEARVLRVF